MSRVAEVARTLYNAAALGVVTQFDNQVIDHPDAASGDLWVRLSVKPGESEQQDIGGSTAVRQRTIGVVIAQVFSPLDVGDKPARDLAELIRAALGRKRDGKVQFRVAAIETIGRSEPWWQVNVTVPFYEDEVV